MKTNQLIIFVLFIIISISFPHDSYGEVNGKISFASGKVMINGKPAKNGDVVRYGDRVTAGDKSVCEIIVGDNGIMKIRNNAQIVFNIAETEKSSVDILRGWFAAVFKKRNLRVITPTAIAGIRGTSLCIEVENNESTHTCTCNGNIQWAGKGHDKGEVISAAHHARRHYKIIDGKVVVSAPSCRKDMLYHTDRDIEELAEKINVRIDWGKAEM